MQQVKSLGSAKIISLNKDKILDEMKKIVEKIKNDEKENLVDIILFGSLAKGDYTGFSDVDIVIILKNSELNFIKRIQKYLKYFYLDIPVDLFVYTLPEFKKMRKENNYFIKEIIDNGISILK
ncbi:MAG: nucleotidyltransferase domain-containing protein [Caldisericia bacterium]